MYAIYVVEMLNNFEKYGWLKGITIHRGAQYEVPNNGLQRIEPKIAIKENERKTWKSKEGAIKYAEGLKQKFEVRKYERNYAYPNLVIMRYEMRVIDLDSNEAAYVIKHVRNRF